MSAHLSIPKPVAGMMHHRRSPSGRLISYFVPSRNQDSSNDLVAEDSGDVDEDSGGVKFDGYGDIDQDSGSAKPNTGHLEVEEDLLVGEDLLVDENLLVDEDLLVGKGQPKGKEPQKDQDAPNFGSPCGVLLPDYSDYENDDSASSEASEDSQDNFANYTIELDDLREFYDHNPEDYSDEDYDYYGDYLVDFAGDYSNYGADYESEYSDYEQDNRRNNIEPYDDGYIDYLIDRYGQDPRDGGRGHDEYGGYNSDDDYPDDDYPDGISVYTAGYSDYVPPPRLKDFVLPFRPGTVVEPPSQMVEPLCTMCYEGTADTLLLPCRHLNYCGLCCDRLGILEYSDARPKIVHCPLCRQRVLDRITVFRG